MKIDIESIQTQMNGNKNPPESKVGRSNDQRSLFFIMLIERNLSKFMLQQPVELQFVKPHH